MTLEQELHSLLSSTEKLGAKALSGQQGQIVAVKTAKDNVYYYINKAWCPETFQKEEMLFLNMLREKEDTQILFAVCLWNGGGLDIPSIHFRKGLLALCHKNEATKLLLQGEHRLIAKNLQDTMPPAGK